MRNFNLNLANQFNLTKLDIEVFWPTKQHVRRLRFTLRQRSVDRV